ncbi:galanin receptor type 1-like isoform X1 [Mytilus edulis]
METVTENISSILMTTGNDSKIQQPLPIEAVVLVSSVWSLIIVTGAIGNGLVLYILFRFGERSVTNVYVINLAFADLMFIIFVVPATLVHIVIPTWILGDAVCKLSTYMIYVPLHATCLTLSAMTIDRYHAIVNPIRSMNWRSAKVSSFISLGVWAVSISISLPFFLFPTVVERPGNEGILDCVPKWPGPEWIKTTTLAVVMTTFFIPMTAITICYGCILQHLWKGNKMKRAKPENEAALPIKNDKQERQLRRKKRVTRMVAIVVFLFALCWFPIHLIALWIQFDPNFPRTDAMHYFKLFGHTLSYANSCVNPFVYAFVNEGFKQAIIKRSPLITKLCQCVLEEKPMKNNKNMIDKSVGTRPTIEGQTELQTVQNNV